MNRAGAMRLAWLAGALMLVSVGCGLDEEPTVNLEPSGSARVSVALPRSLPADSVARVEATVTPGTGAEVTRDLTRSNEVWDGRVSPVQSGDGGTVSVSVLGDGGTELAEVVVGDVALPRHQAPWLVVVPQPVPSAPPSGDVAPLIDAVVLSASVVKPGGALTLQARARDPNEGDTLTYAWTAKAGTSPDVGTFTDAGAAVTTWTAPSEDGPVTLTLKVTDAQGSVATLDIPVPVRAVGLTDGEANVTFNRWPAATPLVATPSQEVRVGESVTLQTVAVDEDGDPLSYAWTAECEGTFADGAAAQASFTPSTLPPDVGDNCLLVVTVTDGKGGQVRHELDLRVVQRVAPVIESTSQSSPEALAGDLVRLGVTARDLQGEPLRFTWSASEGLLGTAASAGGTSELVWTALSCLPPDVVPTVEVTVTNASGLSARQSFTVEWKDRRCGAHGPCAATVAGTTVTLGGDCTTEGALFIPEGYTLDGAGHTLTAVEAEATPESHWKGPVVRNRGTTAHVRNVTVEARGLGDVCDAGADRLSGIRFEGASGSITDTQVRDLHQKAGQSGCQEGAAIDVRHAQDAVGMVMVEVLRNRVSGYQKAGIVVAGRVDAVVRDNEVRGGGPTATIARNGIQLGYGATGEVSGNVVDGHSYTGTEDVASGILVVGGAYYGAGTPLCKDVVIQGNDLDGNDVGINLSQADGVDAKDNWIPPAEDTRIQVVGNELSNEEVTNGYVYQAGISDLGRANVISLNKVSGDGYSPTKEPGHTFDVDVLPEGDARKVAFVSPERTVEAGACSGMLVVQSQDAVGNLASLSVPTLSLSMTGAASPGATFHQQSDCGDAPVKELSLDGAQRESVFYFRAEQSGDLTVKVEGDAVSATQAQTVK